MKEKKFHHKAVMKICKTKTRLTRKLRTSKLTQPRDSRDGPQITIHQRDEIHNYTNQYE